MKEDKEPSPRSGLTLVITTLLVGQAVVKIVQGNESDAWIFISFALIFFGVFLLQERQYRRTK